MEMNQNLRGVFPHVNEYIVMGQKTTSLGASNKNMKINHIEII